MALCTLLVFLLALFLSGRAADRECSDHLAHRLVNELEENRQVVIDSLLETFSGLSSTPGEDHVNSSLHTIYTAFSKKFSKNTTKMGFCHFLESLNMISAYYYEANTQSALNRTLSENIHALVQNFRTAYSTKNSIEMCDLFGKMLNLKDRTSDKSSLKGIQRRDVEDCPFSKNDCSCPLDGINSTELLCSCQFFACLDEGRTLMPIFEGFVGLECLAFVLDTTGSMKDEIDVTLQVIKDFIASEELGCYLLVPFNDKGNSKSSVGPVTLTLVDENDPNNIQSLRTLVSNLETAFQKESGGDCPEYCYDGILEALNTKDYGFPIMMSGSQLVVITDAPSKGLHRATDIIRQANAAEVCIHFFLGDSSYNCFDDDDSEYETIANQTGGIVVKSKFDFSTFVHQYRSAPCGFLSQPSGLFKRSIGQVCHSINVACVVCLLSLSVKTEEEMVTITKPDGEQVSISPKKFRDTSEQIVIFSERHPMSGEWSVCANSSIEVSVDFQTCIDIAPFYITCEREGKPILTTTTPPGCTLAHISVVSTRSTDICSPRLSMLDRAGSTALQAPLETCGSSMSANITIPSPGMYYYKLQGEDLAGNPFSHIIQRKISVSSGASYYTLNGVGARRVQAVTGQVVVAIFQLNSTNPFGAVRFNLTIAENISLHHVSPSQCVLASGQSLNVTVRVRPTISQQSLTLIVSNECSTLTATKIITVVQPPTTAGLCEPPCLNGGRCVTIRRRRRQFHLCRCPPSHFGRSCENHRS